MKSFITALLMITLTAITPARAEDGVPAKNFHIAQTEAEVTLNMILKVKKVEKAQALMTADLVTAIESAKQAAAQKMCKEPDTPREVPCKIDSPITCGKQEMEDKTFFITLVTDPGGTMASIMTASALQVEYKKGKTLRGPLYIMVKEGDTWKLDGIQCRYNKFNVD